MMYSLHLDESKYIIHWEMKLMLPCHRLRIFSSSSFVQISLGWGPNFYQIKYGEVLDFHVSISNGNIKCPIEASIFSTCQGNLKKMYNSNCAKFWIFLWLKRVFFFSKPLYQALTSFGSCFCRWNNKYCFKWNWKWWNILFQNTIF